MIQITKGEQKQRELLPEGSHVARLYSIVEIGHVPGFQDQIQHKLRFTWEVPGEMREFDGVEKPMVIGAKYTVSLAEKSNLLPIVEGMTGALSEEDRENFDLKSLLGNVCMISVVHRVSKGGNKYPAVLNTMKLPKGVQAPEPINPTVYLDWGDSFDQEAFNALPGFIREDMQASEEWKKRNGVSGSETDFKGFEYPTEEIDPKDVPF